MTFPEPLGIVAIGRNEGQRLVRCLSAARRLAVPLVYVDSASSDGSAETARELGVSLVELDPSRPLSAARARNAGFARLAEEVPNLALVMFVDGDCELVEGWLEQAAATLVAAEGLGAVCGRRLERDRSASPYNRLVDLEWDTPIGRAGAFGGDALIRADVFRAAGGYDETLIAGEDPDLAARILDAGWQIERLAIDMTVHDANLTHFSQWWTRQVRAGHAAAEAWLRGSGAADRNRRRVASIALWGGLLPIAIVMASLYAAPVGLVLGLGYPVLGLRIYRGQRRRGRSAGDAALYAASCIQGKFAELKGMLGCFVGRLRQARPELIEYK